MKKCNIIKLFFFSISVGKKFVELKSAFRFDSFSNRITRDGAVYIAPMLERCGLLRLSLAYNRLEDEGAGHLATALLQSNSRLRRYIV